MTELWWSYDIYDYYGYYGKILGLLMKANVVMGLIGWIGPRSKLGGVTITGMELFFNTSSFWWHLFPPWCHASELPKAVSKATDQLVNNNRKFIIRVAGSKKTPAGVSALGYHVMVLWYLEGCWDRYLSSLLFGSGELLVINSTHLSFCAEHSSTQEQWWWQY